MKAAIVNAVEKHNGELGGDDRGFPVKLESFNKKGKDFSLHLRTEILMRVGLFDVEDLSAFGVKLIREGDFSIDAKLVAVSQICQRPESPNQTEVVVRVSGEKAYKFLLEICKSGERVHLRIMDGGEEVRFGSPGNGFEHGVRPVFPHDLAFGIKKFPILAPKSFEVTLQTSVKDKEHDLASH